MRIAGIYSFNKGKETIEKAHPRLLAEIGSIITSINASRYKNKKSKEKTMKGRMWYSPVKLNKAFKAEFQKAGWQTIREKCDYLKQYYIQGYSYIDIPVLIYGIGV